MSQRSRYWEWLSVRPHGLTDQSRRIVTLIRWGWSVCYWKIYREATVPDALVSLLESYRSLVLAMHALPT